MTTAVGYSTHPATFGRWELIEAESYSFDGRLGSTVKGVWRDERGRVAELRFPTEVVYLEPSS